MYDMSDLVEVNVGHPSENIKEIIYIAENECMPGIIKIGRSTHPIDTRIITLDNTSVPLPFRCTYAVVVASAVQVERRLHLAFEPHRVRANREFFRLDKMHAVAILELLALETVTPQEKRQDIAKRARTLSAPRSSSKDDAEIVIDAIKSAGGRPITQTELASIMRVQKSECSKRVTAAGNSVRRERRGQYTFVLLNN